MVSCQKNCSDQIIAIPRNSLVDVAILDVGSERSREVYDVRFLLYMIFIDILWFFWQACWKNYSRHQVKQSEMHFISHHLDQVK